MLRTLRDRRAAQPERGEPVRARRSARRPWLLLLVAAFLVVAAFVTGQLTTTRGWLMVALAVLLVIGTGVTKPTLPHSGGRTTAGAAQLCPEAVQGVAGDACDFLAKVWHAAKQARQRAATTSPTTTTRRTR